MNIVKETESGSHNKTVLKADNIFFSYRSSNVLTGVDLRIKKGQVTALIGPNACGKSTLLKNLNGILRPKEGDIQLFNKSINSISIKSIAKHIAYIPQFNSTNFPMTVFEAVMLGLNNSFTWQYNESDLELTSKTLYLMGINNIADRNVNNLSGGQRQRVSIARALVRQTEIIIMDEPTSSLDLKNQYEVMGIVHSLARNKGIAVLAAIHDINLASVIADSVAVMSNGKIFCQGTPNEVIEQKIINNVFRVDVNVINYENRPFLLPKHPAAGM